MAKVMVSMPDELLAAVDAEAARRGTTRSGLLRTFADDALGDGELERQRVRAARIDEIYRGVKLTGHGGDGVELIRRGRAERDDKLLRRR